MGTKADSLARKFHGADYAEPRAGGAKAALKQAGSAA